MNHHFTLIDDLERAISFRSPERRVETLNRITDLFVAGSVVYSDAQIALFDDVITRLVATVEAEARAALANRLAAHPDAPPKLMRSLASDDAAAVAGPVLARSERLDDAILVETARTKSQSHLLAISQRRSLSEAVTDVLVERGDQDVVRSAAGNTGARFSDAGYATLVDRSDGDDLLAACVGSRPEIPRHHFLRLLAMASESVRMKLESSNPHASREIRQVVAKVERRIQAKATRSRTYSEARALVGSLHASGRLDQRRVAELAKSGWFEETVTALSVLSGLSVEAIERAMVHERAELVLIVAKAIELSWRTAKELLLLRADMSAIDLERCAATFERLRPATAQQIVRFHRARERAGTLATDQRAAG